MIFKISNLLMGLMFALSRYCNLMIQIRLYGSSYILVVLHAAYWSSQT